MQTLYRQDYHAWCDQQVHALISNKIELLDLKNLAEEIKDMGTSEEDNLENRMIILFEHLLKCLFQPERRTGSWDGSIEEARYRINRRLKKSPSLKPMIDSIAKEAYIGAMMKLLKKFPAISKKLPKKMPFSFEQAMNSEF